jgi:signal transduction histidine kinase
MTDDISSRPDAADDVFRAQFDAWRLQLRAALQEYHDSITALDQSTLHDLARIRYGDRFPLLIAELIRSAHSIIIALDNLAHPHINDKGGYLGMVFADLRNPIGSLVSMAQLLQAQQTGAPAQDTALQMHIERLSTSGRTLRALLDALVELRQQYAAAVE